MRFIVALLSLTSALVFNAIAAETANMTPDALAQRGIESYRAGKFADAATDLDAAAQAFLSQEQMQNYVNTGKFPNIDRFETALVYLTLAQVRLGQQEKARDAVLRLTTAERIQPTYAQLPLPAEVADFESTAARLVPGLSLSKNVQLAGGPTTTTAPIATPTPPAPAPTAAPATQVAQSTTPAPAPAPVKPPPPQATPPVRVAQTSASPVKIDELAAQECEKIQKAADERIAAIQRAADERVAQAQRAADAQVAAIQAQNRRNYLLSLRQADAMASAGKTDQANDIYNAIVNSQDVPREIVAEAAVGLYRTSAFRDATSAFRKLAPYAHGEADLRYYNAVSLYETGNYDEAKRELACALPYIQVTSDVIRYREKIEQTPSRQASR